MTCCVILAGGLGTRMRSVTADLPKVLVPVRGQPFVHHQLTWLAGHTQRVPTVLRFRVRR